MYRPKPYARLSRYSGISTSSIPEPIDEEPTTASPNPALQTPSTRYKPYRKPIHPLTNPSNPHLPTALAPGSRPISALPPDIHEVDFTERTSFIQSLPSPLSPSSPTRHSTLFEERFTWQAATHFASPPTTLATACTAPPTPAVAQVPYSDMSSKQYMRGARRIREPWETGYWKRFPMMGVGAVGTVVLLTGAAAAIIWASDGTAVDGWKIGGYQVQPHVYAAILETAMVLFTLSALGGGVVVAFWRQLLGGTTIGEVHDLYESSFLLPAVRSVCRLRFNRVAIACIFSMISLVRGPLFQRAIGVSTSEATEQIKYQVNFAYIVAGIAPSVTGAMAALSLYYGYWELGRTFSLHPLEVARAFGAPLFDGLDGNVIPQDIDFERGDMAVRYGALERNGWEKLLRVEEMKTLAIRPPWRGEIFG